MMSSSASVLRSLVGTVTRHRLARAFLGPASRVFWLLRHNLGSIVPCSVFPRPDHIALSITAKCNLRCMGCRYGRDFMPGHQLNYEEVRRILVQGEHLGVSSIKIYGGEPLLHPHALDIVREAVGMYPDVSLTTNGLLLSRYLDDLWRAGLRSISIGLYGVGKDYDNYVGRMGTFANLEKVLATARKRYGQGLHISLGWLLMRPTCNRNAVKAAVEFAHRYSAQFCVNLLQYSLPYFSEGPGKCLALSGADKDALTDVVEELLKTKSEHPCMVFPGAAGMRSIVDWMTNGSAMKVPCDHYDMIWVGPDGSVKMCYTTFKLGNVRESEFDDLLYTRRHRRFAAKCIAVDCPNCRCGFGTRVERNAWYRLRYSGLLGGIRRGSR